MNKLQSRTTVGQTERKTIVPFVCYILFSALLLPPAAMKSYGRSFELYGGLSMDKILQFFREGNQRVLATVQTAFRLNSWENMYREAETQRRQLKSQLAELKRKAGENRRLRQLLGLSQSIEWHHVNAEIIARSGSTLQDSISIDVGREQGVYRDAPVIGFANGKYGLIGKIQTVGRGQSVVVSLGNRYYQLGVTAMLADSRFQGILSNSGRQYRLDFINRQALNSIQSGELIVSAGSRESLYPRGIPIGYVQQVEELEYNASLSLIVNPVVELSQIEYVAVLIQGDEISVASPQAGELSDLNTPIDTISLVNSRINSAANHLINSRTDQRADNQASTLRNAAKVD